MLPPDPAPVRQVATTPGCGRGSDLLEAATVTTGWHPCRRADGHCGHPLALLGP